MKRLTYSDYFPDTCGAGSEQFNKLFPKGTTNEVALLKAVVKHRPRNVRDLPYYMTKLARKFWFDNMEDYTGAKRTNFAVLDPTTQRLIVKSFVRRMSDTRYYDMKDNVYKNHDGRIFKATQKAA